MHLVKISLFLIILAVATTIQAKKYHGKFTTGGYLAKEEFSDAGVEQQANDVSVFSNRFYLEASELGRKSKYRTVIDLRDKIDLFDKLDREKLELTEDETFQVRQLSLKRENPKGDIYWQLGRFPLLSAGAIYTDGLEIGTRSLGTNHNVGAFAGFNPKQETKGNLEFENKAMNYGPYWVYQYNPLTWGRYAYVANSFVTQTYDGQTDRMYWFNNSIYQWNKYNRLSLLYYLDFEPSVNFQNLWGSYFRKYTRRWSSTVYLSRVDVIEYSRRRGIRERLEPSVYEQGRLSVKHHPSTKLTLRYNLLHGKRKSDGLSKTDYSIKGTFPRVFSKRTNLSIGLGNRNNFTSDDTYASIGYGYYSKKWEFTIDQEFIQENEKSGITTHPMITEINLSHVFSKTLFSTLALQYATDENVDITSLFYKLTYRFGNRSIPPVRDGAPPRGAL